MTGKKPDYSQMEPQYVAGHLAMDALFQGITPPDEAKPAPKSAQTGDDDGNK